MTAKTWLCPLCSKRTMPYGKLTCDGETCGNEENVNGAWYRKHATSDTQGKSIGIAEIANSEDVQDE